ncbi:MAG: RNA polymerase sigma factor [Clostridia bacterium]|nr:RNA polymerase sigma factor [Clostridia bacterium]
MFLINESKTLRAIAAGNTAALRQLYEKYGKEMYKYALSIVKNHQSAEDIVHDSFVCIMEKANTYNGGKEKNWIMRIVHNVSIDYIKCASREISSEHIPSSKNKEDRFYDIIHSIPDTIDRQIIILRIDAGYKIKEIAELLEVSPNAVSKRYRRILKKLENVLKNT